MHLVVNPLRLCWHRLLFMVIFDTYLPLSLESVLDLLNSYKRIFLHHWNDYSVTHYTDLLWSTKLFSIAELSYFL